MVAMAQLTLIMVVYVISFVPLTFYINGVWRHILAIYLYYINHTSNIFIYLSVSKEFRKETRTLVGAMMKKAVWAD